MSDLRCGNKNCGVEFSLHCLPCDQARYAAELRALEARCEALTRELEEAKKERDESRNYCRNEMVAHNNLVDALLRAGEALKEVCREGNCEGNYHWRLCVSITEYLRSLGETKGESNAR